MSTVTGPPPVSVAAPSNANKTATKVANSGGHANTQAPAKRSSSGADGDYALVQHEVLYSLSAQYEVSSMVTFLMGLWVSSVEWFLLGTLISSFNLGVVMSQGP